MVTVVFSIEEFFESTIRKAETIPAIINKRPANEECAGFGAQKFGARNFEPTIWCLRFSAQKRDLVPGRFSAWEILCLKYDLVPGRFSAQRFGDREI